MTTSTEKFRTTLTHFENAVYCYEAQPTELHKRMATDLNAQVVEEWLNTKGLPSYWGRGYKVATIEGIFNQIKKSNNH